MLLKVWQEDSDYFYISSTFLKKVPPDVSMWNLMDLLKGAEM